MTTHPYRLLFGCEPEKFSNTVLRIRPGSMASSNGDERFDFTTNTDINLSTVGLNGMDVGSPANGDSLQVYMISNGVTNGFLCSKSIIYGGVTLPNGYTAKRKLPFGFIYKSAWGGIPDYHLEGGHLPFIRYTGSEATSTWMALSGGVAQTWTDIDLSGFMPDNARLAHIKAEVIFKGRSATAYLRSYSTPSVGEPVGTVNTSMTRTPPSYTPIRVSSTRKIQYRCLGGCALNIQVIGYSMTEAV